MQSLRTIGLGGVGSPPGECLGGSKRRATINSLDGSIKQIIKVLRLRAFADDAGNR